jgi:Inhibitor of vertebrate lysozyme (Ivy)
MFAAAACSMAGAASGIYLSDAIKHPAYSRALAALLDQAGGLPTWTRQVLKPTGDYVGSPVAYSAIGAISYALFHTCKAHDCAANQLEIMFAPHGAQAWGAVIAGGQSVSYLGAPSTAQQSALHAALQQ